MSLGIIWKEGAILAKEDLHQNEHSDFLLRYLIRLADHGAKMKMMLHVHGLVITGELVGNELYLREMERTVIRDDKIEEKMDNFFKKMQKKFKKEMSADAFETGYIHMKDVTIHLGGEQKTIKQTLWRGRASQVDGFSLIT